MTSLTRSPSFREGDDREGIDTIKNPLPANSLDLEHADHSIIDNSSSQIPLIVLNGSLSADLNLKPFDLEGTDLGPSPAAMSVNEGSASKGIKTPGKLSATAELLYRNLLRRPKVQRETDSQSAQSRSIDWETGDYFIACTPTQLKELDKKIIKKCRALKTYIGPPSSPPNVDDEPDYWIYMSDESDYEEETELKPYRDDIPLTPLKITNYNDLKFYSLNPQLIHEKLVRRLGYRDHGIQVLGSNAPGTHYNADNMSDYYQMPLIESPEQAKTHYITSSSKRKGKGKGKEIEDPTLNIFHPKQSQAPAQSFVLYFHGRGCPWGNLSSGLARMDDDFIFKCDTRWFDGYRIAEHWEMNESMAQDIGEVCKSGPLWWHGDKFPDGRPVNENTRILQDRIRARKMSYFVRKTIENYLWQRCNPREERPNAELPRMDGRPYLDCERNTPRANVAQREKWKEAYNSNEGDKRKANEKGKEPEKSKVGESSKEAEKVKVGESSKEAETVKEGEKLNEGDTSEEGDEEEVTEVEKGKDAEKSKKKKKKNKKKKGKK